MDLNNLSAKEICLIIKTCKDANVEKLSLGSLEIVFSPQGKVENAVVENPQIYDEPEEIVPVSNKKTLETLDEEAFSDAEESQLLIDDPLAYEKHFIRRDIERNRVMRDEISEN